MARAIYVLLVLMQSTNCLGVEWGLFGNITAFNDKDAMLPIHVVGVRLDANFESVHSLFTYTFLVGNPHGIDSSSGLNPLPDELPALTVASLPWRDRNLSYSLHSTHRPRKSDWEFGVSAMKHDIVELGNPARGAVAARKSGLLEQTI